MSSTPRLRIIDKDELAIVRELAMIIWPRLYRNVVSPVQMDAIISALFDLDTLEDDMDERGHIYWLASAGSTPAGFLSAALTGDRIDIHKIYVREDFRGTGLGKALMQAPLDHFPEARSLSLIVPVDHDQGAGFARHSGFEFVREDPVSIAGYDLTNHVMHKALT
ncbi:GNAT family N-acetyltransferase [Asticcacaulis tiandongensis]|uniref:GNAT family N-acetyltransferase n=1 Tax=Asticcacaulis tiandongensis TaxID=2565365 RepID=UPI00112DAC0D|nr:GNAT family N-acetyltransferase [Asticcacaulis tiandongensis]